MAARIHRNAAHSHPPVCLRSCMRIENCSAVAPKRTVAVAANSPWLKAHRTARSPRSHRRQPEARQCVLAGSDRAHGGLRHPGGEHADARPIGGVRNREAAGRRLRRRRDRGRADRPDRFVDRQVGRLELLDLPAVPLAQQLQRQRIALLAVGEHDLRLGRERARRAGHASDREQAVAERLGNPAARARLGSGGEAREPQPADRGPVEVGGVAGGERPLDLAEDQLLLWCRRGRTRRERRRHGGRGVRPCVRASPRNAAAATAIAHSAASSAPPAISPGNLTGLVGVEGQTPPG